MEVQSIIELKAQIDAGRRSVYGWGNVSTVDGVPVVDSQGGYIPIDVLETAVKKYTAESGRVQFQHESLDSPVRGKVVQSFVMKSAVAKSLGIASEKEGWLVEIQVDDPDAWQVVEKGYISGLSLGGIQTFVTGQKEAVRLKENPTAAPEDVKLVTGLAIKELSLVFAPANPLATVDMLVSKGKDEEMSTPEQIDRIKELEAQVAKMESEKQVLEVRLSALQPSEPVTLETILAKGLGSSVVEFIQAAVAKADSLEKEVQELKLVAVKSAAVEEIGFLQLGDKADALAVALLKAGDAKQVILEAFKGLKEELEQVRSVQAIALGCKPKGGSKEPIEALTMGDAKNKDELLKAFKAKEEMKGE